VVTIPSYPEVEMAQTNVLYIQLEDIPFETSTAWLREANYTLISIADINRDYRPIEAPAYQVSRGATSYPPIHAFLTRSYPVQGKTVKW
jgi:hypothetical protein